MNQLSSVSQLCSISVASAALTFLYKQYQGKYLNVTWQLEMRPQRHGGQQGLPGPQFDSLCCTIFHCNPLYIHFQKWIRKLNLLCLLLSLYFSFPASLQFFNTLQYDRSWCIIQVRSPLAEGVEDTHQGSDIVPAQGDLSFVTSGQEVSDNLKPSNPSDC